FAYSTQYRAQCRNKVCQYPLAVLQCPPRSESVFNNEFNVLTARNIVLNAERKCFNADLLFCNAHFAWKVYSITNLMCPMPEISRSMPKENISIHTRCYAIPTSNRNSITNLI